MKGLLIKDFLYLKQQGRALLVLLIFFVAFAVMSKGGAMTAISGLAVAVTLVVVINTFAFDEGSKWDIYAFSLPVRKKQIVLEKYVFLLLMTAAVTLISGIFAFAFQGMENFSETLLTLAACAGIGITICSVILPFVYRFGVQKSWLICLIIGIAVPMIFTPLIRQAHLNTLGEEAITRISWSLPFIVALIFIGSYLISCRIVKNKEL